jgi:hypothetical protein
LVTSRGAEGGTNCSAQIPTTVKKQRST